jgi:hypothetical protein
MLARLSVSPMRSGREVLTSSRDDVEGALWLAAGASPLALGGSLKDGGNVLATGGWLPVGVVPQDGIAESQAVVRSSSASGMVRKRE